MNDSGRNKTPGSKHDDWDDDGVEYEVEPPDADVIALKKQVADQLIKESELSIDVDEIYRKLDHPDDPTLPFKLPERIQFRFQVKHILIATGVLAVLLTMWRLGVLINVGGVLLLSVLAGVLAYTEIKEQQRCVAAECAWQEKLRRRRKYFEEMGRRNQPKGGPATIYDDVPFNGEQLEEAPPPTSAESPFRLQFSLRQLFIGMTVASVLLGLITWVGSPAIVAMMLGTIALLGLVVHAFGVQLPQIVVLGWWFVLVLYMVLGLATEVLNVF